MWRTALLAGLGVCLALGTAHPARADDDGQRRSKFAMSYGQEARGDILGAIRSIEGLGEDDYLVQLRLGWLHYRLEAFKTSADFYAKAARLAPEAVEPLLGMMLPLQAAGFVGTAIQAGNSVLELDPGNYTALSRLASIHYSRKDYGQAASLYGRLTRLYPTDTEMLLGLGWSLKLRGDKAEAAVIFRRVLVLGPDNPRALAGLR
ncbi:MAG: tetratricopeptide repeat protein [Elusimicrobia bacterium]|nr:tetratricopeptide repeat protein [Elusimicrobiota bacterium]